ncbi:ABC transporter substrate-binding protein [Zhihengliuella halotolerans]|uniref:ABC transporter substrate-binding protein n=1 Tax=Zhihengliuella halotolerans TaxID=370736 RepID=UPI000C7F7C29|nr:extracellular solute-binding protein [Zhihengliuella halotolerans]
MNARYVKTLAVAGIGALALSACGSSEGQAESPLKVWTLESQPDRISMLQGQAEAFTEETGTEVEVVAVDEAQYNQLLVSGAAAGELPDVIGGVDLVGVGALAANELIAEGAATEVVDRLGAQTFDERALERASIGGDLAAVPSDSWTSVLIYRQDLFDEAGLDVPDTYEAVLEAAERLDGPGQLGFAGFTSNHEALEHFALANGCDVVDENAEVVFDSPACVESLAFYNELIGKYSAAGEQDVNSVRANYLSGRASMAIFSSFILDELAGLNPDFVPTCDECDEAAYLAENTGVVTTLNGPNGGSGQYGKQTNWAIPVESSPAAVDFVEFMMSDGYESWLSMAPEGKVPTRTGTTDAPEAYVTAWRDMPSGVGERAPLSDFYPDTVIEAVETSPAAISEWGIEQGQAPLMGAILGEQPVVQAMSDMFAGNLTPEEAATRAAEDIRSIRDSLR